MRRASASERGETLLELIVAISIMGIAMTAILGGVLTAVSTSGQHRSQAQANALLLSASDAVKEDSVNPYVDCATPASYSPTSGVSIPGGWSGAVAITSVQYWNGATGFTGTCAADLKLQLVTIEVTSPDGKAVESLAVVKRKPA